MGPGLQETSFGKPVGASVFSNLACRTNLTLILTGFNPRHACSTHTLEKQALNASRAEVRYIVIKYPQVFNLSIEKNLRLKIDFFVNELQGSLEEFRYIVVGTPSLLGYSLTKRMHPRVKVIRAVGVEPNIIDHIWLVSSSSGLRFSKWLEKVLVESTGANGRGDIEIRRRMKEYRAILHNP